MNHLFKIVFAVFSITLLNTAVNAQKKPNIIVVFADDISARELPIYNSSQWSIPPQGGNTTDPKYRAETPVMDKLANEGVYIKSAWGATICSPSRAMMMTGRYAHIHKWWHLKDRGTFINKKGKKVHTYPLYESSPHTIGHIAKAGGYATYWAGKTQIDGVDKFGFDEGCFTPGINDKKNPYSDFKILQTKVNGKRALINTDTGVQVEYYQQFGWYWKPHVELMNHPSSKNKFQYWPNTPESKASYGLNTFGPDVELDFILDFMERKHKEDKPFFVYHTTHLGHDGWDFFSSDINKKTRQKWPGTPIVKWENGKYTRTEPNVTGDKGNYNTHGTVTEGGIHNHVKYLDYQLWQYVEKLKELGIEDNTILVFCADNGTSGYGKGSVKVQQGPHIPMIIYAPGLNMTKKGAQDVLADVSDILPTIAEVAGVKVPDNYELNGKSLIPFLTTNQTEHREYIYTYHMEKQLIRSKNVLIDGNGKTYNVSEYPENLISFPVIKNLENGTKEQKKEYKMLKSILPKFDLHATEHDAPINGIGEISPLKVIK
ncbi:sulfatase-like hydrolase/transferase [Lutibacter sp. TH_r2]|uniref:sulfatase-like hydrolase/transferase n=1 Tax=Lutibacter sp. TH_r2 TaxID=3082083 RepID=UPI002955B0E4|nr:sulfatase-like hydrolase/transferase [Lutibacter sp. TH_r2]MDV7187995.1 sulfatase-like hydrolase/transferase [Lutibacter sp. TH_r2]